MGNVLLRWLQKLVKFKHKLEFEGIVMDLRLHIRDLWGLEAKMKKSSLSLLEIL